MIEPACDGPIVLLNSLADTDAAQDGWMLGRTFVGSVREPIEVMAKEDFDDGTLLPFYTSPTIMRNDVYEAILSAGVGNIEAWDAVVRKADGSVLSRDYKAYNVIGVVSAAGKGTVFSPENGSRMIDASIESLSIDHDAAQGLVMFRLAEYIGAVVVHETVKKAVESRGIENISFSNPEGFIS